MNKKKALVGAVLIVALSVLTVSVSAKLNFATHLSGDEAGVDTKAQGQAIFHLSKDGTELKYKLIAANIENITMAHIHFAPAGQNGPIVVWLYPSTPPAQLIPGRFNGVLAIGTITASDLIGPLAGLPLDALITNMTADNTYVNLHTAQNTAGEIRGQI